MQSPEYSDLTFVKPRSWTRTERTSVQLIVIHTTEGSAHNRSAEDGAAYDARREDGTSTHYFVDNDSVIQCVETRFRAHTARSQGNRRGIQYELCTRARTSPAGWMNPYHQAMLRRAAKQAARDAKRWGIPVRKISAERVAAGERGFCGHVDITRAFPADGGTHTDPGINFPWAQFLALVKAELEPAKAPEQEDDMDDATIEKIANRAAEKVWGYDIDRVTAGTQSAGGTLLTEGARSRESRTVIEPGQDAKLTALQEQVTALTALVEERLPAAPNEPAPEQ